MKRSERHHLKENELVTSVARARETFEEKKREIIAGAIVVVVILGAVGGYFFWRGQIESASRAMFAEALAVADAPVVPPTPPPAPGNQATPTTPPPPPAGSYPTEQARLQAALGKFTAVADRYPATVSGIAARYQAAATLAALGRNAEAIGRYKEVIERAGDGIYGEASHLGLANLEAQAGQYDAAVAAYKDLSAKKDGKIPVDGVLMQLGRTYAMAGRTADALRTFQRIVDEFPQSAYAAIARREIDGAKTPGTD
jgi:tetratricopeptide (TPR) repeat protein